MPSPTITQAAEITPSSPIQSVTDYPAFLWSPFPPPDGPGSYLPTNLYSTLPVNSTEWQIETSVADLFGSPSMIVSPDRTKIILLTVVDSNGDDRYDFQDISKIHLYTPADGLFENLIDNEHSVYKLNWLPDSQRFVYAEDAELVSGDLDGSPPQLLASFPDLIANIATSPNGSQTAVSRFPGNLDFWNMDTGTVNQVASETTYDLRMVWSPDSHWLAFNKSIAYGLYLVNSDTLETFEVTIPVFDIAYYLSPPFWSPDSQRLAFTQGASTLFLWDSNTQTLSEVAKSTHISEPAWSLDSQQLAFTQDNTVLHLWDVNTQTSKEIARATYMGKPAWSPDSQELVVGFSESERSGIFLIDKVSQDIREISQQGDLGAIRTLMWSPDSNWIAFFAAWNEQTGLFLVDIKNEAIYIVLETTGTMDPTDPVWLPLSISSQ
jgi:Tol biopolymer transport system component